MNKSIALSLVLVTLISAMCKQKSEIQTLKEIPIKYVDPDKKEKLSTIVSAIKYIKLETRPDFLLDDIKNVKMLDKLYCLNSNRINVFDLNGKALFEINHYKSREPGGYMELSDFQIDTTNEIIETWDRFGRRINRYDRNNGKFLSSQKFDVEVQFFTRDTKGDYYFYAGYWPNPSYMKKDEKYMLLKFDKEGNFLKKFLKVEFNNKSINVGSHNILYTYKGSIYLNPPANNFVYILKQDTLSKIYQFNFGKYTLKDEYFKEYKYWDVSHLGKSKFAWSYGKFREYNLGWSYTYHFGPNRLFYCLLSKTTGKNIVSNAFENDFDGGFLIGTGDVQDDVFITSFGAQYLLKIYSEIKKKCPGILWEQYKIDHSNFCTVCENLTEMDNPVIIVMTPKEF